MINSQNFSIKFLVAKTPFHGQDSLFSLLKIYPIRIYLLAQYHPILLLLILLLNLGEKHHFPTIKDSSSSGILSGFKVLVSFFVFKTQSVFSEVYSHGIFSVIFFVRSFITFARFRTYSRI